jgi:hypothetical protein
MSDMTGIKYQRNVIISNREIIAHVFQRSEYKARNSLENLTQIYSVIHMHCVKY